MGLEARCVAKYKRQSSEGLARLETADLQFRGDFRLRIRFAEIQSVKAARGVLRVETRDAIATFDLGPAAETWALKIRYPKPVIDKLGVKPGQVVSVLGIEDAGFLRDAGARAELVTGRARAGSHLIFFTAKKVGDLARLAKLKASIRPDGAIWVVWKKGVPTLKEDHVRAAALPIGLVDVKVVAFSDTHSALKLMIRKSQR